MVVPNLHRRNLVTNVRHQNLTEIPNLHDKSEPLSPVSLQPNFSPIPLKLFKGGHDSIVGNGLGNCLGYLEIIIM